jgi:hypothetical protein
VYNLQIVNLWPDSHRKTENLGFVPFFVGRNNAAHAKNIILDMLSESARVHNQGREFLIRLYTDKEFFVKLFKSSVAHSRCPQHLIENALEKLADVRVEVLLNSVSFSPASILREIPASCFPVDSAEREIFEKFEIIRKKTGKDQIAAISLLEKKFFENLGQIIKEQRNHFPSPLMTAARKNEKPDAFDMLETTLQIYEMIESTIKLLDLKMTNKIASRYLNLAENFEEISVKNSHEQTGQTFQLLANELRIIQWVFKKYRIPFRGSDLSLAPNYAIKNFLIDVNRNSLPNLTTIGNHFDNSRDAYGVLRSFKLRGRI